MGIKDMIKSSWMPILIIILLLGGLALFIPEVKADTISLQDTTNEDWFEIESEFSSRTGEKFYDMVCAGEEWDFNKPMPEGVRKELQNGEFKYCIQEIILKNPTTDFISTTDFKYTISDMGTGVKEINFLILNPENPKELIEWDSQIYKTWQDGLTIKIYAYGVKNNPSDIIEWDFNITYKPLGLSFYHDPFWYAQSGFTRKMMDSNQATTSVSNEFLVGSVSTAGYAAVMRGILRYDNDTFRDSSKTRIKEVKLQLMTHPDTNHVGNMPVNLYLLRRNVTLPSWYSYNTVVQANWTGFGANSTSNDYNDTLLSTNSIPSTANIAYNWTISNITFESMMNGTLPNNGFLLRTTDAYETSITVIPTQVNVTVFYLETSSNTSQKITWWVEYENLNAAPTVDTINISSYRGWNTSSENLFGGFSASDPDANPLTNETLWYKDDTTIAALNDLQEIASSNTSAGEVWIFSARVNDGTVWSDWKNSSDLTINTLPTQDTPILNSTDGSNRSSQNLKVWNQTTADVDDNPIKNIVLWLKENNHYAHLYLPFEGGSLNGNSTGVPNGTRDYSEHGNNATVYNATWLPTGGYDGFGAYSFDGIDDFIDLNASTINFNQTSGTMMVWFKMGDAASWSDGLTRNLFQFRGGAGNAVTLYKSDSNEMRWRYVANSIADEVALDVSSRTDTDWHHMAMTWSVAEQEMMAYWDGVQTGATQVITNNWTQDAETGKIGVRFSNDLNFNGTIDEVQSYHHALSAEQILAFATNTTDMIVSQETAQGQIWKAQMTPNDGREDGLTTESNTLTILNAIPTIPSINITSSDPLNYTNGTLTGWHNYNDVDGDAWGANSTKWYRNTTEQTSLYNLSSLASGNLTAEDTWVYSAAVQDAIGDWSLWYNSTITIINAPPYEVSIPPSVAFDEDSYNDTITNASIYFYDLEQTKLGFEFYGNDSNLNTTITNATGAILFTAVNDWFGSVTGYFVAVDNSVAKGNGTNFTITVNDVNDQPTIPFINITSTDMLNRTNGTLLGQHGFADLENNTWALNWTKWFKDDVDQITFENTTTVINSSVSSGETWIYSARVNDGIKWSDWLNSTSLLVTDSNASISIITLNNSLGYFDYEDIGFSFKPFDPDGGSVIVSLNITNNNVNIYTQLASILSDTTYSGNLSQNSFNQTQVINITVLPNSVVTELKNATTTIKSITVTASDSWYYGINETESGGYNLTVTESSAYPYDINISAIFYRGGITYTPSTLQYRIGGVTIFNVTIPMPLTPNNHTNISSRWEWNQSVYGSQSTNTESSRNQTVDHGYFLTDFFSTPTNLLEAERFLARINYSSLQLATISNSSFELTGLNFSAPLNGSTQFYNPSVYSNLLPESSNSSTLTLQAKANYTYLTQSMLRNKNTTVTINKMLLTECGGYTNTTTHLFESYNESEALRRENSTIQITYEYFQDRNQEHRNFSGESGIQSATTNSTWNYTFCIWPTWTSFNADTTIQYTGGGFTPRTYYHYGLPLSNVTQTTKLYMLSDELDTAINVYLLDQDDNAITKALLKVLRFYPEESVYRTVQVSESDVNGLALIKIRLTDVLYKLMMDKDGELIDQTDKFPFIDSDYFFRINILADFLDSWTKVGELNKFLTVNNNTGTGTFYWNDGQDIVQTGCLEVFTRTALRDNQLYYQCLNASIGTITYTVNTSVEGRYMFRSTIDTNTNNTLYYVETLELIVENARAIFGIFGVFLTLLFFVGVASAGLSHNPSTSVMFGAGAFLVMAVLGFIYFPWTGIITLMIIAIFITYMIRT